MQTTALLKKEASKGAVHAFGKFTNPLQRKAVDEEEDALQMKQNPLQLQNDLDEEEDEPLQLKKAPIQLMDGLDDEDEEPLQMKQNPLQRVDEDEELLQTKENPLQLKQATNNPLQLQAEEKATPKPKKNDTGLPDNLKAGVEALSGYSMDDVKVHYNSDKPAQLQALAYAQGTDIHVAPGQEQHLPHEAWHVVQQKQGRVQPRVQMMGGIAVDDNKELENEADEIGNKALSPVNIDRQTTLLASTLTKNPVIQPVWEDITSDTKLCKWNELLDGKQWYYNKSERKYYYTLESVEKLKNIDKSKLESYIEAYEIDKDDFDLTKIVNAVKTKEGKLLIYHAYFTQTELEKLTQINIDKEKEVSQDISKDKKNITDPIVIAFGKKLFEEESENLYYIISIELQKESIINKGVKSFSEKVYKYMFSFLKENKKWEKRSDEKQFGCFASEDIVKGISYEDKNFFSILDADLVVKEAFYRGIWDSISEHAENEEGFPEHKGFDSQRQDAIGMQREIKKVNGITLHFTNRVKDDDLSYVENGIKNLYEKINGINITEVQEKFFKNLKVDLNNSLRALVETTKIKGDDNLINEISKSSYERIRENQKLNILTLKQFIPVVFARLKTAFEREIVHVIVDRAVINDVSGKAAINNKDPTPQDLINAEEKDSIKSGKRIIVNLDNDQGDINKTLISIAHEIGHSIGFNNIGADRGGHFGEIEEYLNDEDGFTGIPRILFDAYFFEIIIKKILI